MEHILQITKVTVAVSSAVFVLELGWGCLTREGPLSPHKMYWILRLLFRRCFALIPQLPALIKKNVPILPVSSLPSCAPCLSLSSLHFLSSLLPATVGILGPPCLLALVCLGLWDQWNARVLHMSPTVMVCCFWASWSFAPLPPSLPLVASLRPYCPLLLSTLVLCSLLLSLLPSLASSHDGLFPLGMLVLLPSLSCSPASGHDGLLLLSPQLPCCQFTMLPPTAGHLPDCSQLLVFRASHSTITQRFVVRWAA